MEEGQVAEGSAEAFGLSRRSLIGGLGAAGAIGLAGALAGGAPAVAAGEVLDVTDAIEAPTPGLVYLPMDAFAFDVAGASPTAYRIHQIATGVQPNTAPAQIYASLPIPIGSVVKKINVAYVGQPIIAITRRVFGTQALDDAMTLATLPLAANPATSTVTVDVPFTAGATYGMRVFCSAGQSIYGMEIGYVPAAQAFIPFTGNAARVFDSRDTTRFNADEERVVDLSSKLIATARAAVVNVTATQTAGPGFVAAFADGIAWPNNSTVNFSSANLTVANGAVVPMTGGKIKLRCGPAASHILVDVIGSLL